MNNIYRKTYAEINLKNLYDNYKNIKALLNNKTIIPVVKANAYGHGVMEVVQYLIDKDINYFAVSLLEEALELRQEFNKKVYIIQPTFWELNLKKQYRV